MHQPHVSCSLLKYFSHRSGCEIKFSSAKTIAHKIIIVIVLVMFPCVATACDHHFLSVHNACVCCGGCKRGWTFIIVCTVSCVCIYVYVCMYVCMYIYVCIVPVS